MIFEYAIDPHYVVLWAKCDRDYSEFIRSFGVGTPRILAGLPKANRWRSQALKQIAPSEADTRYGMRVRELAVALSQCTTKRSDQKYNRQDSWVENAALEHSRVPFDYVVVTDKTDCQINEAIIQQDFYKQGSACWYHDIQQTVERSATKMSDTIRNLLRLSREIILTDPYLQIKPKTVDPIVAHIRNIVSNRVANGPVSVKMMFDDNQVRTDAKRFYRHLVQQVGDDAEHVELSVMALRPEEGFDGFHNRFVLTELGGVMFPWGLAEGDEGQTDDITLLVPDSYRVRWGQFNDLHGLTIVDQYPLNT